MMTCDNKILLFFFSLFCMSHTSYNTNHQSVKRILRELKEFQEEEDPDVVAWPLEVFLFFFFLSCIL